MYGSVTYQLRDANRESSGTCDFVWRGLKVISKTVFLTVLLSCLMVVPLSTLVMGVQYLEECPLEPKIPLFLVIAGSAGLLKMIWLLSKQIRSRRYEALTDPFPDHNLDELINSPSCRATDYLMTVFLIVWYGFGNFWIYSVWKPNFTSTLYEPNNWCSITLYYFAIGHVCFVYLCIAGLIMVIICLGIVQRCCRCFGDEYK